MDLRSGFSSFTKHCVSGWQGGWNVRQLLFPVLNKRTVSPHKLSIFSVFRRVGRTNFPTSYLFLQGSVPWDFRARSFTCSGNFQSSKERHSFKKKTFVDCTRLIGFPKEKSNYVDKYFIFLF